jgi:myo-inositol 2-dehydrogenase / D-chiro-inositol 1-dehydrogenase
MSVGVGVIGTGVMGSEHARLVGREIPDAHLAGVFDADAARAQTTAADATLFPDPRSLIKSDRVGAVIIASPDATHAELTLACLEAGKIERGWLVMHESGTIVRFTQAGVDLFA